MNTERILHIADLIEKLEPQQFDMNEWANSCGTVACIAGWTYLTYADEVIPGSAGTVAAEILGLDEEVANSLFVPTDEDGLDAMYEDITPAHAAQTLRKLAETGEVDWSHVG